VEKLSTTLVKPLKLLEKSKSLELNPREIWSQYPRMKKCSTKIHLEKDVRFFQKKNYACWLNLLENFFTTKSVGILVLKQSDQQM
jgi:hypothetical protein